MLENATLMYFVSFTHFPPNVAPPPVFEASSDNSASVGRCGPEANNANDLGHVVRPCEESVQTTHNRRAQV